MDSAFSRGVRKLLLLAFLIAIVLLVLFPDLRLTRKKQLEVQFFDVGQGDSIFIESPAGVQVLIDGGPDSSVLHGLGRALGFFDRDIDLLMATHPDLDHIGGLIDVLDRYRVKTIVLTENKSNAPVADMFQQKVRNEGATVRYVRAGQIIDLGRGPMGSTTLTVLFPDRDVQGLESNTSSIVSQLQYGNIGFMLTGDSPSEIETYLVSAYSESLESEVLKVGHHGSRTSSDPMFVSIIDPEIAVISSGKDNRYGHPHKDVLSVLQEQEAEVVNTAENGTIILTTDGVHLYRTRY